MLAEVHPNIYCCFEWNSLSNQQQYDLNSVIITISSDENSGPWSEVLITLLLSIADRGQMLVVSSRSLKLLISHIILGGCLVI